MTKNHSFHGIAVCLFGMESTVAYELKQMGIHTSTVQDGRVHFEGSGQELARANICLRCAERVLIQVGEFEARSFEELFQGVFSLDWGRYLPLDCKFPVARAKSINSKLFSVSDIQSIAKKAIVEKLKLQHKTAVLPETGAEHAIHVFLHKDVVQISIDTTGEALHKRGYRALSGGAPIRETMAAFMVMLTPWKGGRLLVDPLCGSGTIAIEAAMIGANIMPGVNRHFAGEKLSFLPKEAWVQARKEAVEGENQEEFTILASDMDEEVLQLAKDNAELAGVAHLIRFEKKNIRDFASQEDYGFIITNPPYGERMGSMEETETLYKIMGSVFRNRLQTWSFYVITTHEGLENLLQIKAQKKRKLYNGMIKTWYYQFPGPKPPKTAPTSEERV